ncbi:AAA family ATPase [Spirosoma sp. HMF3257]|uniref:ATP-binding protein n=1 Tax=Spirosoma telluris TaxID=2183553 RepID=A0A327NIS9_9BACT|nr:AAA family ATPase [Spirosoma telluris]RAI75301.1 ATP-binding protein [Spirosoma telluris]
MNQDLMTRLFRSIEGDRDDDIVKVAYRIVEDERNKGHDRLADRLTDILEKNLKRQGFQGELKRLIPQGVSIPTDTRNKMPLATPVERDLLRHEMVLPTDIEAKIQRIEKEYVARERLARYGLKPKKKILLYGHPGCGKSMSAERIAWNIGLPFLKVRFEAIISSYLGESATNLTKLFESLKTYPCVLLLDEFDFIAQSRTTTQDVGEMHRVVNILLNLLEEYNAPGLIIATTNLEGNIDKALFRRFDDIIEIPLPQEREIDCLLKMTLSAFRLSDQIDWPKVVTYMEGFSAALIVKIAQDAAKMSVIAGKDQLSQELIWQATKENSQYK